jgi:hypothetical protein
MTRSYLVDIVTAYMTILLLSEQLQIGDNANQDLLKKLLRHDVIKIMVIFAAAQAATSNFRASVIATYLFYSTSSLAKKFLIPTPAQIMTTVEEAIERVQSTAPQDGGDNEEEEETSTSFFY